MGTLVIVGTGIGGSGRITVEAMGHIRESEKVLYLVADAVAESWIIENNNTAESLSDFYYKYPDRYQSYIAMADHSVGFLEKFTTVCIAFYGHPGIFVLPAHEAIIKARNLGHESIMLPAVSAEDCLFADLGIDPGRVGCQSFESTDFLVRNRLFDPNSVLVLWQIGALGEISYNYRDQETKKKRLKYLVGRLIKVYGDNHRVIIYEAAQHPIFDPLILEVPLGELSDQKISEIATLVIPPLAISESDLEVAEILGIPDEFILMSKKRPSGYDVLKPNYSKIERSL